jgi:hypothetical protein
MEHFNSLFTYSMLIMSVWIHVYARLVIQPSSGRPLDGYPFQVSVTLSIYTSISNGYPLHSFDSSPLTVRLQSDYLRRSGDPEMGLCPSWSSCLRHGSVLFLLLLLSVMCSSRTAAAQAQLQPQTDPTEGMYPLVDRWKRELCWILKLRLLGWQRRR